MEFQTTGGVVRPTSTTAAGAEIPTVEQLVSRQRQIVGAYQEAALKTAATSHARDASIALGVAVDKLETLVRSTKV